MPRTLQWLQRTMTRPRDSRLPLNGSRCEADSCLLVENDRLLAGMLCCAVLCYRSHKLGQGLFVSVQY